MRLPGISTLNHHIGVALAALLGCVPDNQLEFPSVQNYFPLRVGDYRIYQVTETKIAPYNIQTQSSYELKTVVTDSFANADGKYSYLISRFKRENNLANWDSFGTWSGRANESEVVITDNNVPYLKFSYPVEPGRAWNGNVYNNLETNEFCSDEVAVSCDLYSFGAVNTLFQTSGGLQLENTTEVIENNDPDVFVKHDIRKTIYALNIGIVRQEIDVRKFCTNDACYGKQLVEDGLIMLMELKEYGRQ